MRYPLKVLLTAAVVLSLTMGLGGVAVADGTPSETGPVETQLDDSPALADAGTAINPDYCRGPGTPMSLGDTPAEPDCAPWIPICPECWLDGSGDQSPVMQIEMRS